ncbi:sensor histidine kinase [Rhodococcus sp. OK302]|uniref:sensor histidine kinase n=1 Tax=Rhodococcus sp. OK302 TaxID=1882769 RepID=UPI000B9F1AD5|nr:ATP-binding protein [Rhodococcus sp. OK302]OYD67741.1 signal transduction histidine kinase [Rhodococcus sp. OK302]
MVMPDVDTRVASDDTAVTTAGDNIRRLFGRFICVGYFLYLILLIPDIHEASTLSDWWWNPLAVVTIFGAALALGLSTFHRDVIWVSRMAAVNAIVFIVVELLWWPAWNGEHISDYGLWTTNFPGVASLAAAAAWRPTAAFAHLLIAVVISQLTNHIIRVSPTMHLLVPDLLFAFTFCAVFVAAAVMALRTGQELDATIARTHAAAASAAAAEAKSVERERFDALIHDTVMSTLLSASRNNSDPTVIEQARRTVARLDDLRSGTDHETNFDIDGVLAQFRSAASELDENITFDVDNTGPSAVDVYPTDSIRAMSAALAEALRNSMKHAGPTAHRRVSVTVTGTQLEVLVADNGVGFDPTTVSTHRLGIAVSIRGRMRQLEGGSARVQSAPGRGTTVVLDLKSTAEAHS